MLLERDQQLTDLGDALDDAAAGRGSLVLISGEAGVGKTSLIEAFLDEQGDRARTLWGACDDLLTPRPLGPFHDIARQTGGELAQLLQDRGEPHEVMAAFLTELERGSRPTVAVIEDAHWADQASLDVIRFAGRRLERSRAVVIVSFRDDEAADHPLLITVGSLPPTSLRRIELGELSADAVAALAEGHDWAVEELIQITGGNPFFVTELVAAPPETVPRNVRAAVLARTGSLSKEARDLLELASVVPARAERELLEASVADLDRCLTECEEQALLHASSDTIWFRHELARRAVESSLPDRRRRALNYEVLRALEEQQADPARLVHHAEEAGNTEAVLRWAVVAARQAAKVSAHREASAHFARTLPILHRLDVSERAQVYEEYAMESYIIDHGDAAIEAALQALELRRELEDQAGVGRTLRLVSRIYWWRGERSRAERAAAEAVEALEQLPPSEHLAMAYSNLAQLAMLAQQKDAALSWGRKAIELAERLEAYEPLSHALNNVGSALWIGGEASEGEILVRKSLDLARREGLHEHACRSYTNLVWYLISDYQYDRAAGLLEEALAYSREYDQTGFETYLMATRAIIRTQIGDWAGAEKDADAALSRPEDVRITLLPAGIVKGTLQVRRGDPAAAGTVAKVWEKAEATGELQRIVPAMAARAELAWFEGDMGGITSDLRYAYDLALSLGRGEQVGQMALWAWRAGMLDRAPFQASDPYRWLIEGKWDTAAEAWEEQGQPYEQAVALAESDEPDSLQTALDIFEALGARVMADRVRSKLGAQARGSRVLATVLFTDLIDSTGMAAEMGDRRWKALLDTHDSIATEVIGNHEGTIIKTSGDGLMATFDAPTYAIDSAFGLRDRLRPLGLEMRAGVHTGEIELRGHDIGGIGVHISSRISDLAGAGEVFVSETTAALAVGSGFRFEEQGAHPLKGVPGEWKILAAVR
ncbi:MAG: AAA family ATPase [Acidimicrobiia bacterium]